jgi:multidrug/hemolysin transport system permease protein
MIIIIGLMALFLGNMNTENVINLLEQYGGERNTVLDHDNAKQLVLLWTMAGIVVVNSVTITLAMVGIMVEDEDRNRLASFYVSPVNRVVFVLGYIISAIVMGIIMCILTVGIGEGYVLLSGGNIFTLNQLGRVLLLIVLNVFTSSCFMFLVASFIHSTSAFAGVSTIVGTLVGFLAAIYLPMGMLPNHIQKVLKMFPLLHGSSLMRSVFTEEAIINTFTNCPAALIDGYKETMGITFTWSGTIVDNKIKVAFMVISGIIFITISTLIQRKRHTFNR